MRRTCNERVGVCHERVGVLNERVVVCHERVGVLFFNGMWPGISKGFFTETTGSLRNPETRRTPSYIQVMLSFLFYTTFTSKVKQLWHMYKFVLKHPF